MTDQTARLGLPFLMPSQALKHVTINDGLTRLDGLVQLAVESATLAVQPAAPADGACYILPPDRSGPVWSALAPGQIVQARDGGWDAFTPLEGFLAWVRDTDRLLVHDGAGWSGTAVRAGIGLAGAALVDQPTSVSGPWTFTNINAGLKVSNIFPKFMLEDTDAAADERKYLLVPNSGTLSLYTLPDDESAFPIAYRVIRSGAAPAAFEVGCQLRPLQDNAMALGHPSLRWSSVYAATGTITTSDARHKTPVAPPCARLLRAIRRVVAEIGVYQWLDAVACKGVEGARLHIGVTAQSVRAAFEAEGLDPDRYALFCADPVWEEVADAATDPGLRADGQPPPSHRRQVLDPETGAPLMQLGVRADQLAWLALAAAFAPGPVAGSAAV